MPYTLTRGAKHTIEIVANLESEAVDRERNTIVRTISRKASVPGFRPGKAPAAAVKARYSDEIQEELQDHLTGVLWREVFAAESDLQPLTNPNITDLEFGDDGGFQFTAALEIRPEYELSEVGKLDLPQSSLDVSDAEIDGELAKVAEEQASWEPAEEAEATDGTLVEVDLEGRLEDSEEEPFTEKGAQLVIGAENVPPEISEALQGAKTGDVRTAKKVLPDDLEDADKAGKTVSYTLEVKGLKEKVVPQIDEDLATTIGLESLEQLRERIVAVLGQNKRNDRRTEWRRFILDHLEEGIDIGDLPSTLVQSTLHEQLDRYAYTMAMQGVNVNPDDIDWQELAAKAEPAARQEVLDTLVLEQLAKTWEIPVPETEVDAYVASDAARLNIPPAEHKAKMAAEEKLERVRHAARIAATVDELIRRAGGEVE